VSTGGAVSLNEDGIKGKIKAGVDLVSYKDEDVSIEA
jgi:hypothetical protein